MIFFAQLAAHLRVTVDTDVSNMFIIFIRAHSSHPLLKVAKTCLSLQHFGQPAPDCNEICYEYLCSQRMILDLSLHNTTKGKIPFSDTGKIMAFYMPFRGPWSVKFWTFN